MSLELMGWDDRRNVEFAPHLLRGAFPARVNALHRGGISILTADAQLDTGFSPQLRRRPTHERPGVGDWVAVDPVAGWIDSLLERRSAFIRKAPGGERDALAQQVVAANVDVVFIVAGLDGDFNPRRVERYLALAWESGATPVVLLNKSDLSPDLAADLLTVDEVAPGVDVHALSARHDPALSALDHYREPGRTLALLGSSGVGKSTLVNRLLGDEVQATQPVRETDSRGRHTTTRRELFVTDRGCLIDTPGLREIQIWDAAEGIDRVFPEIVSRLGQCRFSNCQHLTEPGCALLAALEAGDIAEERFAAWCKLVEEEAWFERRHEQQAQSALKQKSKAIHKPMRHFSKG